MHIQMCIICALSDRYCNLSICTSGMEAGLSHDAVLFGAESVKGLAVAVLNLRPSGDVTIETPLPEVGLVLMQSFTCFARFCCIWISSGFSAFLEPSKNK